MPYPTGHYGPGIRGLGDALTDIAVSSAGDLFPIDASTMSFGSYANWISGGSGVSASTLTPTSTTNATGSNPTAKPTVNQIMGQNSGLIIMLALGLLGLTLLKK